MKRKIFLLLLLGLLIIGVLLADRRENLNGFEKIASDVEDLGEDYLAETDGISIYLDRQLLRPAAVGWNDQLLQSAEYISWDEPFIIQSDIPMSDIVIKKVLLTYRGSELTQASDVSFENNVFYHQPWGDIWEAHSDMFPLMVGYRIIVQSSGQQEYRFVVKSSFPSLDVRSLLMSLEESFVSQNTLRSLAVSGDTDGDGETEEILLNLSNDKIPFLTVNNKVQLCLSKTDPSYYENAEMVAVDLDNDSSDEIVIFWNNAFHLGMQVVDYQGNKWIEKELPIARAAAFLAPDMVTLSFPDGNLYNFILSENESLQTHMAPYYGSDGNAYSGDVEAICFLGSSHCIEETPMGTRLQIEAEIDLCATAQIENQLIPYQQTIFIVPIEIRLDDDDLFYVYEKPLLAFEEA